MKKIGTILKWVIGIFFILIGITWLLIENYMQTGIFSIIIGLSIIPPTFLKIESIINKRIPWKIKLIALVIGLFVWLVSFPDTRKDGKPFTDDVSNIEIESLNKESLENEEVPFQYTIERQNFDKKMSKASFDIRLKNRISKNNIKVIADRIKFDNPNYDKYFILYYLPDMKIGSGAWATSHYTPDLFIDIIGISADEAKGISKIEKLGDETIGSWFDSRAGIESMMTIYKEGKVYKWRKTYSDKSFEDIILTRNKNTFRYDNGYGEFLKIESDGKLGLYSSNGRYAIIPPKK